MNIADRAPLGAIALVALILSACGTAFGDPCSSLKLWSGGEHDTALSTVQSLRYHICKQDWGAAATTIAPNSDYAKERQGNRTVRDYWVVPSPITEIGELFFPLGPNDGIVVERISGKMAEVELRHDPHYEKGPRPRALELQKIGNEWLIVGYNNW